MRREADLFCSTKNIIQNPTSPFRFLHITTHHSVVVGAGYTRVSSVYLVMCTKRRYAYCDEALRIGVIQLVCKLKVSHILYNRVDPSPPKRERALAGTDRREQKITKEKFFNRTDP